MEQKYVYIWVRIFGSNQIDIEIGDGRKGDRDIIYSAPVHKCSDEFIKMNIIVCICGILCTP